MSTFRRVLLASSMVTAAGLVAPAASAFPDSAATDCATLNTVITRDESKLDGDAQGLTGHIHTLIHSARLVSADADTMSTDITNAHVTTPGLTGPATQFAGAIKDLSTAMKTLIAALEPLAGNTAQHVPGLHQRIQTVTTDVAQRCPESNQSADCKALIAKMREVPQDPSAGMGPMADKMAAYSTSVGALSLTDANLKKDRDGWAAVFHDLVAGLRGVAAFQSQMDPLKTRGETAAQGMKTFCASHAPASSSTTSSNPPPPPPPPPPPHH
jgi:hypothetical protein